MTPQDVLREAAALLRAVEDACPVCHGEGWTVDPDPSDPSGATPMQVPCWDAEHSVILNSPIALDKAIAEAPDSPRHGPAIWGDYGVTCACTAVLEWPPGWARNETAANRLTEKHAKESAAPDTLSEKPGLDARNLFSAADFDDPESPFYDDSPWVPADDLGRLSNAQVETIYAAYDTVIGHEARTIEGKRKIVEPIYEAVIAARVQAARSGSTDSEGR